jgi:uncharacterized integral membrane protein
VRGLCGQFGCDRVRTFVTMGQLTRLAAPEAEQAYDEAIPESTTSHFEVPATRAKPKGTVMSTEQRAPSALVEAAPTAATTTPPPVGAKPVPRTRTSATWLVVCGGALSLVVLIVFMLQNTRSVEVSFLWMHGTLPLALALLIAGVGVAVLVMVVGAARITQLRRLSRQRD